MFTEYLDYFITFVRDGGVFMHIISLTFLLASAIALERFLKYSRFDLNASKFMHEVQQLILANKIKDAIQLCSGSQAVLPKVIKNGLKRTNQGTEQIQNALDATVLEIIPEVDKRLNYLNLFANISTLLGLLGTIFGLILAFSAVGTADPSQRAAILSSGISKAMNTTAFGLISAIIIMIYYTVLSSKSEKIISDIDQYSVKLMDVLGTMKIIREE